MLTTVIGSYPQPDWLIDREKLRGSLPARVRMRELWRVEEPYLAQAQDDATALAIRDQERAGVDIVTDGEIRRESYSNRFATALEGFDIDNPAMVPGRAGGTNAVPRIVGKVRRTRAVEVDDLRFLRAHTDRTIKITLPGPFTMSQQASNEAYDDEAELAMDLAVAVNEEVHELFAAGADVVQIDEPWLQSRPEKARAFALPAIDRALAGATGTTVLHTCFGYAHVVHDRPDRLPVPGRARRLRGRRPGDRGGAVRARPGAARADRRQDGRSSAYSTSPTTPASRRPTIVAAASRRRSRSSRRSACRSARTAG